MNPPPHERGGRSRYGPPPAQHAGQQQRYPFVVDPTEAAGAAVRAFFPAPGTREPPPPSSSSAAERALVPTMQHGHHYGGGCAPEISLAAHGHAGQGHHGIHHRYHQFGVEGRQDGGGPSSAAASLQRHSTSPPGFFSSPVVDNGFPSTRAGVGGEVHNAMSGYDHQKKMKSPMNLSRQGTLSQFSENGIPDDLTNNVQGIGHSEESITANNMARSFSSGFSIGSWEGSNSIVFSNPASKSGIIHNNNDDIVASISNSYELQFGVGKETAGLLQMQEDQVPLRVRAKRGCATHPRSIAERERRTRISDKLRKLQALVPNMDKQTSTADMLDLAVDHIRGLQSELQALKEDKEKCTCRGNRSPGR